MTETQIILYFCVSNAIHIAILLLQDTQEFHSAQIILFFIKHPFIQQDIDEILRNIYTFYVF